MAWKRVSGTFGAAAVLALLTSASTPATAADLASTYAHDVFPEADMHPLKPPASPCRQARVARRARPARRNPPAATRESGTRGDAPVPDRAVPPQSASVLGHPDEDPAPR
jgi:hypothetical protein